MKTVIRYPKQFSKEIKEFVIVLTNFGELKSIKNLPIDSFNLFKTKEIEKILKEDKYYTSYIRSHNDNTLYNVKILFIKNPKNDNCVAIGSDLYSKLKINKSNDINFVFSNNMIKSFNNSCSEIIFGLLQKSYIFSKYKNKVNNFKINSINILNLNNYNLRNIDYYQNLLFAINYTKDLVSEPANILNPINYAQRCQKLQIPGLKIKILDLNQIKKIGMNALLAVSLGSENKPRVVIFEWNLKKNIKPTILVGKGITFDTGGISLKPSSGMEEMITDMGGSAVVVGSMINAALNKSNKSIVGIIGLVENMPDGKAQRPGDIVKSLSGQTIEVLNTDAEGRLVLADLITYIQSKYNPKEIIDFATLTGAIMVALGTHRAGLFSNNDRLSNKLFKSGVDSDENIWRLPMGTEYDNDINSKRADVLNTGTTRWGGSITAAHFIKRFVENNIPWAHIDIAGVSWTMKGGNNSFSKLHSPGATAFGVRLIDQFLNGKKR
tara:strand:+ start:245 stop:1726 length:1482 start_codon:yes stop_codon:yes gene_type:complete